jgi:hypothetical protein
VGPVARAAPKVSAQKSQANMPPADISASKRGKYRRDISAVRRDKAANTLANTGGFEGFSRELPPSSFFIDFYPRF